MGDLDGKKACPWCGGPMPAIARRCPHCNRAEGPARPRRNRDAPVACPSCKSGMSFLYLGEIQIDCCQHCAGTWFDDGELEALPAELSERDLAKGALSALDELRGLKSVVLRQVRYLTCPVCDQMMTRRNYEQVSGIILNRCPGHGTWLDFPNGKALLQLLADERLAEVKQHAQSWEADNRRRERAELEHARLDLEARQRELATTIDYYPPTRQGRQVRDFLWWLLDFFW